ncbi:MAG: antibiotic biosynthesis monooxygenase [Chloroflexi bacterium]|nr:antibiotic biosynthesis monooxygenase [Chloroflexota bacterium]
MIVVCNRISVNPEHSSAFEERFADRANLVDGMPGFISFKLLRPSTSDDPYVVMTFWESQEHFKAWTSSDEFQEGHARSGTLPPETFLAHPKVEVFEVIQDSETLVEDSQ